MKNEQILKLAEEAAKKLGFDSNKDGDFFIGCKVNEVLPNGKISTLVCVDCSWLRDRQTKIIDHNDLDEIDDGYKNPSIKIDIDDIIITKWFDAVDSDGDIHHCKVESFITMGYNPFDPVEDTDWVIYIEL